MFKARRDLTSVSLADPFPINLLVQEASAPSCLSVSDVWSSFLSGAFAYNCFLFLEHPFSDTSPATLLPVKASDFLNCNNLNHPHQAFLQKPCFFHFTPHGV